MSRCGFWQEHPKTASLVVLGLTAGRYAAAERMARQVEKGQRIGGLMTLFVGLDVLDGQVARLAGIDGRGRRAMDAIVDRLSVARAAWSMTQANPQTKPYLTALASRETVVGAANLCHLHRTGEVTRGGGLHKLDSLSVAVFAVTAARHDPTLTNITGTAMVAINSLTALDYVANAVRPGGFVDEHHVRHISTL